MNVVAHVVRDTQRFTMICSELSSATQRLVNSKAHCLIFLSPKAMGMEPYCVLIPKKCKHLPTFVPKTVLCIQQWLPNVIRARQRPQQELIHISRRA